MLNRISYIFLLALFTLCAFLYINYSRKQELTQARLTGTTRCGVCHAMTRLGNQFKSWQESAHARAYAALSSDSARAYMSAHRVNESQCIGCHSTLGRPAKNDVERKLVAEGVGCERCHGPGSNYSEYNVMLDQDEFTSRGGVVGSLEDCYQCHASDPARDETHCPFQRETFIADSAWKNIRHPLIHDTLHGDSTLRIQIQ